MKSRACGCISWAVPIIIFFAAGISLADSVTQDWVQIYNGTANASDIVKDMAVDNSGNTYVTGYTTLSGGSTDILLIKYTSSGTQAWVRTYDGEVGYSGNDAGNAIAVDSSGNVYVAGYASDSMHTKSFPVLLKYTSSGVRQWVRTNPGGDINADSYADVAIEPNGYIAAAGTISFASTGKDFLLVKYNSTGALKYYQTYNSVANDDEIALGLSVDVNFTAVWGWRNSQDNGLLAMFEGTELDTHIEMDSYSLKGVKMDEPHLYLAGSKNITGDTNDYLCGDWVGWETISDSGQRTDDAAAGMFVDNKQNMYVTGTAEKEYGRWIFTIKYDANGRTRWNNLDFPGTVPLDITGDNYGSTYITGIDGTNSNLLTLKYDSEGNLKWSDEYTAELLISTSFPSRIAIDSSGNVYVAANDNTSGNSNIVTIKYRQHYCPQAPGGDLNNDCKFDFRDFAIMAADWLKCNLYPASDCL